MGGGNDGNVGVQGAGAGRGWWRWWWCVWVVGRDGVGEWWWRWGDGWGIGDEERLWGDWGEFRNEVIFQGNLKGYLVCLKAEVIKGIPLSRKGKKWNIF